MEIAGILTQLAFYAGWPPTVSAVVVVDDVFKARSIDREPLRVVGVLLPVAGPDVAPQLAAVTQGAPPLAQLTERVVFGDLWRRTDLLPRDRSLVTIAALVTEGDMDQLSFYLERGMRDGLSRDQLGEAVTHLGFYAGWAKATKAATILAGLGARAAPPIMVTRAGSGSRQGPAEHFTGVVTVDTPFAGTGGTTAAGARVTFAPGARTNWHIHPLGQMLFVTAGHGLVGREGAPVEEVGPGDIVFIAPGVRHWHGATPDEAMLAGSCWVQ